MDKKWNWHQVPQNENIYKNCVCFVNNISSEYDDLATLKTWSLAAESYSKTVIQPQI